MWNWIVPYTDYFPSPYTAIEEIPTNMQFCRSLSVLELSSNPLLRSVVHVYMYC